MHKKNLFFVGIFTLLFTTILISCKKLEPQAPAADEVMDAPLDGLTHEQHTVFLQGAEEFDEVYTSETGLGPLFVANSCASCHTGDNRGHPFTILTRFGQSDTLGNNFLPFGAPQIQNRALPGFQPEEIPAGATSSKFIAPIASGMGFIELVSDADIIAMSDPNDLDGDSISGVPNWNTIPSYVTLLNGAIPQNGKYICRFGRKAGTYNLHQQTVNAFNQDIGITTTFALQNPTNYKTGTTPVPTSDPDISDVALNGVVFYMKTLQAPIQRNQNDPAVTRGKQIFINIGCEKCHKQTLKTGYSPIAPLSNKEFHPFTDLLLHDMGAGLDDHYTEGSALTSEWRTTPLWGLGLTPDAQGGKFFLMHDGRAHSIEEAISMHGGESKLSSDNFAGLSQVDKDDLIAFLKSL